MAGVNFVPTPQEQAIVAALFAVGDPQKLGVIQGDSAVQLLSGADLPPAVLGTIWQIADDENNGFLTRKGVAKTVRLLGHAQKGESPTQELLNKRTSHAGLLLHFSLLNSQLAPSLSFEASPYLHPPFHPVHLQGLHLLEAQHFLRSHRRTVLNLPECSSDLDLHKDS
jgi:epidermal growth factor receptor substrate 15